MSLHVILRTCSDSVVHGGKDRIVFCPLPELKLKCIGSLLRSVKQFKAHHTAKITIVDDRSSLEFMAKLDAIIEKVGLTGCTDLVVTKEKGPQNSLLQQFELGKNSDMKFVYFVEDDYFHADDAITAMVDFMISREVQRMNPFKRTAIYPYDCAHRYANPYPSIIFHNGLRHWRTILHAAYTFMLDQEAITQWWPYFHHVLSSYNEDETTNRLWTNLVWDRGPIALVSPIPSVAVHVSYAVDAPTLLTTEMCAFHKEWNKNDR